MRGIWMRVLMNATTGGDEGGTGGGAAQGAGAGAGTGTNTNTGAAGGTAGDQKAGGGEGTVETISLPKTAFDERINKASEAATRKLLKELGFSDVDAAKGALGTLKSLQDAQKSETEKMQGRIKELEPLAQRAGELTKRMEAIVTREFDALPENIREAIDKVADGDAEKRFAQMEFLKSTGLLGGAQQGTTPPAGPKTKTPVGGPPPAGDGQLTKFQEWTQLRAKNPVQASLFFRGNKAAIEASRPADQ